MTTKIQGTILSNKHHTLANHARQIRVTEQTTGDIVPLYADYSLTEPVSNPFFTDHLGFYDFFYNEEAITDDVKIEVVG